MPVIHRLHQDQISDLAGSIQILRLFHDDRAYTLTAHLELRPVLLLGLYHAMPLSHFLHHGLLAIDGLPRLHGIDADDVMPVIRRGDQHHVDVIPGQDLPIVPSCGDSLPLDPRGGPSPPPPPPLPRARLSWYGPHPAPPPPPGAVGRTGAREVFGE